MRVCVCCGHLVQAVDQLTGSKQSSNKTEAFISRRGSGMCFDFSPKDPTVYIVGTEDGNIHKCRFACDPRRALESWLCLARSVTQSCSQAQWTRAAGWHSRPGRDWPHPIFCATYSTSNFKNCLYGGAETGVGWSGATV